MNEAERNQILAVLEQVEDGWSARLPAEYTWLGLPVRLEFQTEPIKSEAPQPPQPELVALAHQILDNLEDVLAMAEGAYKTHHADYPEFIEHAADPKLWVNIDAIEYDGPERWAFVVGVDTNPGYGTHIVFDGLEILETWGGD